MIIGHGGNIHEVAQKLGCAPADILDMSSNMNPLGPLPGLMDHLKTSLDSITALPQADAHRCIEGFATRYDVDPAGVLAANGTTQFIYTLPKALEMRRVLIVAPTYADYGDACRMHSVDYTFFLTQAERGFRPDMDQLIAAVAAEGVDTVYICNPNNPTGVLIPQQDLENLCRTYPHKRFIIDESYMPFVNSAANYSMIHSDPDNTVVLNSMSKIFRIPGLRIGFVIARPEITARLRHYLMPWSVNTLAQSAIAYLMTQTAEVDRFIESSRRFAAGEIQFFHEQLGTAAGLELYPSHTSFLLAHLSKSHTAESLLDRVQESRILLRNCSNFKGLSPQFIRISIKSHEINRILIAKLRELFCTYAPAMAADTPVRVGT